MHPLGRFKITVNPSPLKIAKALERSSSKFSMWKPAWLQLLPFIVEMLQENIRSPQVAWQALLDTTIKRKQRPSGSHGVGILLGTGELVQNVGSRVSMSNRRLRVAPRDRYAYVQQVGSARKHLPARPFLEWSSATRQIAINVLNIHAKSMLDELAQEISGGN
jgi:hypothetical protein